MDDNENNIELLLAKIEVYGKTTLRLFKLKTIDASAAIISSLISRFAILLIVALFVLLFTIGLSLYIGELIGAPYYGFLVTALIFVILGFLVYLKRKSLILDPVSNYVIKELLEERSYEK